MRDDARDQAELLVRQRRQLRKKRLGRRHYLAIVVDGEHTLLKPLAASAEHAGYFELPVGEARHRLAYERIKGSRPPFDAESTTAAAQHAREFTGFDTDEP